MVYTVDGAGRVAGRCGSQFNSVIANAVQSGSYVVNATYDIGDRLTSWTTPGGTTSFLLPGLAPFLLEFNAEQFSADDVNASDTAPCLANIANPI